MLLWFKLDCFGFEVLVEVEVEVEVEVKIISAIMILPMGDGCNFFQDVVSKTPAIWSSNQ